MKRSTKWMQAGTAEDVETVCRYARPRGAGVEGAGMKATLLGIPFLYWLGATLLLAALALLYAFGPAEQAFLPPCPSHALFGLHCPACGALRAMHHLLHGDLETAFSLNPLLLLSIPVVGLLLLRPKLLHARSTPWIAVILLVSYTILRNIPVWPLTFLAPS